MLIVDIRVDYGYLGGGGARWDLMKKMGLSCEIDETEHPTEDIGLGFL